MNKRFNVLLKDNSFYCGAQLGRELTVKFLMDKGFTKPAFTLTILFASLSARYIRDNRMEKGFLEDYISSTFKVLMFVLFCYSMARTYKERGTVKLSTLRLSDRIKFLATIMQHSPGNDLEKWDDIARHMNYYLHEKGVRKRPEENFFNGKECLNFYRTQFEPLTSGSTELFYIEFRDLVRETNEACGSSAVNSV